MAGNKIAKLQAQLAETKRLYGQIETGDNSEYIAQRRASEDKAKQAEADRPDLGERFSAAFAGNTDMRIADVISRGIRSIGGEFDSDAVEGFKPPDELMVDVPRADYDDRAKARSMPELRDIIRRQNEEADRIKTVFDGGMASGLALSFGSELLSVTNYAAPYAAARTLGFRAIQLANQGRVGASVGRTVAENLASGTAVELALQTAEGRYDPANLALSVVADLAIGGASAYEVLRAADMQRAAEDVLTRQIDMVGQAKVNIGDAATPEQVNKEYARLRTEEIKAPLSANVSPIPDSRKLMTHPDDEIDDLLDDTVETRPVQAMTDVTRFADPDNADRAAMWVQAQESSYNQLRTLGVDLPDAPSLEARKTSLSTLDLPSPGIKRHGESVDEKFNVIADTLEDLRKQFIPDVTLHLTGFPNAKQGEAGAHLLVKPNHSVLAVKFGSGLRVAVHEFGHAVFAHKLAGASDEAKAAMRGAWDAWQAKAASSSSVRESLVKRSPISFFAGSAGKSVAADAALKNTDASLLDVFVEAFNGDKTKAKQYQKYFTNFDEFSAEQLGKFIDNEVAGFGEGKLTVPQQIVRLVGQFFKMAAELFGFAKERGILGAEPSFEKFFNDLLAGNIKDGVPPMDMDVQLMAAPTKEAVKSVSGFMADPVASSTGLNLLPVGTAAERAKVKALLNLHKRADAWAKANPKDEAWEKRANNLIDNSLFSAASTGLTLLKSNNNVARMIAAELLEDASGVSGKRQPTAAISKTMHQNFFMGNVVNEYDNAYGMWRKAAGGSLTDDFIGGEYRYRFDRAVAEEIEGRRVTGEVVTRDPYIKAAADSLESAYGRIAKSQISNKTLGWAALPETSRGYMPHKMSPGKWRATSNAQRQVIHTALVDQFVNIEGWDISFADRLASSYLQRVQARANGGHDSPIGGSSAGAADIVEDAMLSLGMSKDEIMKNMQRFNRGAAGWTKGRLDLDLTKEYIVDGKPFKLLDIFETNQLELLRSQAGRASGEVALARHGVYGKPGLDTIREALTYGADGAKATDVELAAFDQVSAEFLNAPFGTAGPKWMQNAMILNSAVRLGGIVYNQFAEFINGATHLGVARMAAGVASMPRMRSEIKALVRGEKVDNPLLSSIEALGGSEFGTQAYKIVLPFDNPDHAYPTYGVDTLSNFDRLVRGASYAQGKLSLWRTVHSVQQRAMAEQIVAKIARYVRDGTDDIALDQFGITAELRASLKADLSKVASWEGNSLTKFDVTQMTDPAQQEALIQAVHRGVSQIIQGTFIGETGKWAHDGYLKLLTQFRTFSITAAEKQWGRQRNSRGSVKSLGILLGSMFAAVPVYYARVYASSIGREDQEAYIEERLRPELVARQVLNYVALSGLAGDFLDAAAAIAPEDMGLKMTGGRAGTDTEFVGNMVAPSLSLVDDVWKALQNLDDPEKLAKVLPGSRLPFIVPAINELGD